jgi:hypothetical protein
MSPPMHEDHTVAVEDPITEPSNVGKEFSFSEWVHILALNVRINLKYGKCGKLLFRDVSVQ